MRSPLTYQFRSKPRAYPDTCDLEAPSLPVMCLSGRHILNIVYQCTLNTLIIEKSSMWIASMLWETGECLTRHGGCVMIMVAGEGELEITTVLGKPS